MKFCCGIDLGARKTHVCLIDEDDHKMLDMRMDNNLAVIEFPVVTHSNVRIADCFTAIFSRSNDSYESKLL